MYRDWDAFVHSRLEDDGMRKLATRLRVVIGKMHRLELSFANARQLQDNLDFLTQIESSWQPNVRNQSDPYRLVDVYVASKRRGAAGKYDDAVARLYRCLEMAATICLLRDCALSDVDKSPNFTYFEQIYGDLEHLKTEFEARARYTLPVQRLGLKDQMTLLDLSKSKAHKQMAGGYRGIESGGLMEERNRYTLAHGTVPVNQDKYRQFDQKTLFIISFVFENKRSLETLITQATHPELRVEL